MKDFAFSNAGKGTAGVILTCLIIIFPVIGTWLVAGITLVCSLHVFFKASDQIGDDDAEPPVETSPAPSACSVEARPFDVNAALAEMTAQATRTLRDVS